MVSTPTVVIVGRPNVGKSSLFNVLTCSRNALVYNASEVTRDRKYGILQYNNRHCIVIDTGGLLINSSNSKSDNKLYSFIKNQSLVAIKESNIVLFVVDAHTGITSDDHYIASLIRSYNKRTYIIVNKIDGVNIEIILSEFYIFGFHNVFPISAICKFGIKHLLKCIFDYFTVFSTIKPDLFKGIKFTLIGRPNVGKSTLVNTILSEKRVIVDESPGTTIDSIVIPFIRNSLHYVIIDTAGVRRKSKIKNILEKFSVIKSLDSIYLSDIVVFMLDSQDGLISQDMRLINFILKSGKSLIIIVNKSDVMNVNQKYNIVQAIKNSVISPYYVKFHFISALYGNNINQLFQSINVIYNNIHKKISTSDLNVIIQSAVKRHNLPLINNKSCVKIKHAHIVNHNPLIIILYCSNKVLHNINHTYKRYLAQCIRKSLTLYGVPIKFVFKN